MNFPKIFITTTMIIFVSANGAFAAPIVNSPNSSKISCQYESKKSGAENKDLLDLLESKKLHVKQKAKDGQISEEKADKIIKEIDKKVKYFRDLDKLSVAQKKEKLKSDFKVFIDKKTSEGKLTAKKSQEILKDYYNKVDQWDGKGYPRFLKYFGGKFHKSDKNRGQR